MNASELPVLTARTALTRARVQIWRARRVFVPTVPENCKINLASRSVLCAAFISVVRFLLKKRDTICSRISLYRLSGRNCPPLEANLESAPRAGGPGRAFFNRPDLIELQTQGWNCRVTCVRKGTGWPLLKKGL